MKLKTGRKSWRNVVDYKMLAAGDDQGRDDPHEGQSFPCENKPGGPVMSGRKVPIEETLFGGIKK